MRLSDNVTRWVETSASASIRNITPLPGGISGLVCAIEFPAFSLVLRLFTDAEWVRIEPDLARHEAAALTLLADADLPTPELVAFDETGEFCGVPAVLMTRLPGSVILAPADFDDWLRQMADALTPIHAVPAADFPWTYSPYIVGELSRLVPPAWSRHPELWARAIEIANGERPKMRENFIHRDYHPNNILWENGRLTGVVDWVNACRGAAGIDVAWNRQNLVQLHGVAAADRFLTHCERSNSAFVYHPFWDVLCAMEFLPGPPGVYPGWPALGITHLTDALMTERLDDYIASLVTRI